MQYLSQKYEFFLCVCVSFLNHPKYPALFFRVLRINFPLFTVLYQGHLLKICIVNQFIRHYDIGSLKPDSSDY